MRVSVEKDDPGYRPGVYAAEIFLNGERLTRCFTADSDAGIAICAKVDKQGNVMHRDGKILTETKRGNVSIVMPE